MSSNIILFIIVSLCMSQGLAAAPATPEAGRTLGDRQRAREAPAADAVGAALQVFAERCDEDVLKEILQNIFREAPPTASAREDQRRKVDRKALQCLDRSLESLQVERKISKKAAKAILSFFI